MAQTATLSPHRAAAVLGAALLALAIAPAVARAETNSIYTVAGTGADCTPVKGGVRGRRAGRAGPVRGAA